MALATLTALNPVRPHSLCERLSFPTQPHQSLGNQLIDRGVNRRHQLTPICHRPLSIGRYEKGSSDFTWTDRCLCCAGSQHRQSSVARVHDHHPYGPLISVGCVGVVVELVAHVPRDRGKGVVVRQPLNAVTLPGV